MPPDKVTPGQTLHAVFLQIEATHCFERCKDPHEIDRLESSIGHRLPEDLKAFYKRYETAELFAHPMGPTYRLVPVSEIRPVAMDILGSIEGDDLPASWYTLCDVQDGNYVAIDLKTPSSDVGDSIS